MNHDSNHQLSRQHYRFICPSVPRGRTGWREQQHCQSVLTFSTLSSSLLYLISLQPAPNEKRQNSEFLFPARGREKRRLFSLPRAGKRKEAPLLYIIFIIPAACPVVKPGPPAARYAPGPGRRPSSFLNRRASTSTAAAHSTSSARGCA